MTTYTGTAGNDSFRDLKGSDIAYGLGGDDFIFCDKANHSLLDGGTGNDWLGLGGNGSNMIGGDGNDWMGATGGGNALTGGNGGDNLSAVGNANSLSGGADGDSVGVSGNGNILNGGDGDDWMGATGRSNVLLGGNGNDHIEAYGDNNTVGGGAGNDFVLAITTTGGGGHNTFVYGAFDGSDALQGFRADRDVIDLRGWGIDDMAELSRYMFQSDVYGVGINFGGPHGFWILGASVGELTAGNFIFG